MLKRLSQIVAVCAVLMALAMPCALRAQDASTLMRAQRSVNSNDPFATQSSNGYGTNPYAGQGDGTTDPNQQGQPQDTTKKKKRPKRPLESYYFNDSIRALPNFRWSVSRDFNNVNVMPIDTTLAVWRLDYPFHHKGVGDMAIGSLGQASQPINYFDRPDDFDFTFAYHRRWRR